jgi:ComF family protein
MKNKWLLRTCVVCHHPSNGAQDLCKACASYLPIIEQGCQRCATPLPCSHDSMICGHCLKTPPPFDALYTLYHYKQPVTRWILDLKFNYQLLYAKLLGEQLLEKIQSTWYTAPPLPDLIIPVPLHPHRLRERGFNQAVEIARPIAKALQIPLSTNIIQRIKPTLPQATLSSDARRDNIEHAFAVTSTISQKHIALIDDVVTTGNTVIELSRTLKRHGIQKIDIWCIARA